MLKYFKIFIHFQKIGIMRRMAYKGNFFILLIAVFLQLALNLIFIKVIFGFLDNIAGWNYFETLVIVATYMLIEGLMWVLFAQFSSLSGHIREGTLDGVLVKPINNQFLVSFWRGDIEDSVRILTGLAVLIYALYNLDFNWWNLFLYFILVFNGLIITYSIVISIKSISFWVIDGRSLFNISNTLIRMSQYPTDIFYHSLVRVLASTAIPIAFIATVPAKSIIWGFNLKLFLSSFVLAGIFFYASHKFWIFALKHYSSASS